MAARSLIFILAIGCLASCQTIMRRQLGIKDPRIEKTNTVVAFTAKNNISNSHFLKKEKISDSYIGEFPKIYVFDKNGYKVVLPNCYEMIEENLYRLVDTIPDKISADVTRDDFVKANINTADNSLPSIGAHDYEVYFYWSVWLGKFNVKRLHIAQNTIDSINQSQHKKSIVLIPVNFDFIEETGWTEKSVEAEMKRISNAKKMK